MESTTIMKTKSRCYTGGVKPKESVPLNIKLNKKIWDRIEKFRYRRMFPTRTATIEFLLDYALKANPARERAEQEPAPKGEG